MVKDAEIVYVACIVTVFDFYPWFYKLCLDLGLVKLPTVELL